MVEQVRPVVLPLLPTACPSAATPMVLEGGSGVMLDAPTGPRSRMVPERSTWPDTISAIAASTLLGAWPQRGAVDPGQAPGSLATGFNFAPCVSIATVRE